MKKISETKNSARPKEIVRQYLNHLDKHIDDLKNGRTNKTLQIKDIAALLFIHPKHLSNTIQNVLGKSPCDLYEERLIKISKELILSSDKPISSIASHLTFDPSNFTKFFKSYTGMTPKKFREANKK